MFGTALSPSFLLPPTHESHRVAHRALRGELPSLLGVCVCVGGGGLEDTEVMGTLARVVPGNEARGLQ